MHAPRPVQLISIVLPAFNEGEALRMVIPAIAQALRGELIEIIIVDDGSTDATRAAALSATASYPVRYLRFSRNFGKEAALSAGIDAARGQAVIMMDADGQHPVELLALFLERWRAGAEIVSGVQKDRLDTPPKRFAKRLYYRLMAAGSSITIPPDAGDFRLLDRKVVDALKTLPERKRFMKGLYSWVGFRTELIPFVARPRAAGETKYGWMQLFGLGLTGMTAFTIAPLRMVSILGLAISVTSFLFGVYLLLEYFLDSNQLAGWATLAVGMMFFSGLQLLALGLISEYLAGMFEEVKQRPLYIVAEDTGERAPVPARASTETVMAEDDPSRVSR
ncbi:MULTISPECIES: glycosyltransferase family 2 protein [Rhodomicrobium]|uniref:glycosyltransferase family 2 protein n=1 Tax=Rhodomicrobium TaxID=1068 RepID=UPI000B4BB5C0|nr:MULTISPECIES: glycosyltransferase family 2 protein [Rhodomicrobium]